ncbi:UDP-glucose 4-epimerase GalE [soil metagenome]
MTTLVIGGAGYIGAHIVRLLGTTGDVLVVDDLSTGRASRVGDATLVDLDIASPGADEALAGVLKEHGVDSVIHLAAKKQVGESVERPTYYYAQNVGGLANVLTAMESVGVRRLIFSSSAATYGAPDDAPESGYLTEDVKGVPLSPYGETKLIGEWMCRNAERAWGLSWSALRYFNVAGAGWPDLGDPAALNLIPIVFTRLTAGQQPILFGDDYDTPDGTCIRDYIHVLDLADAHIRCLDHVRRIEGTEGARVFNVGRGAGSSVREVLDAIAEATGRDTTPELAPRRAGDPAILAADVSLVAAELGWHSQRDLADMVGTAWEAWQAG